MTSSDFSGFRCILLFLVSFLVSYTLAKPRNQRSNNDMQTILYEMKKQLIQLQDNINILRENKICVKGKICFLFGGWSYFLRTP